MRCEVCHATIYPPKTKCCNGGPNVDDPTPEEIAEMTAKIRARWDATTERSRAMSHPIRHNMPVDVRLYSFSGKHVDISGFSDMGAF